MIIQVLHGDKGPTPWLITFTEDHSIMSQSVHLTNAEAKELHNGIQARLVRDKLTDN